MSTVAKLPFQLSEHEAMALETVALLHVKDSAAKLFPDDSDGLRARKMGALRRASVKMRAGRARFRLLRPAKKSQKR